MRRQGDPRHNIQLAQVGWLVSCVIAVVWLIGTHAAGKIWLLPMGMLGVGFGGHLIYFRDRLSDVFSRQDGSLPHQGSSCPSPNCGQRACAGA